MFVYFGFFRNRKSIYALETEEKIPIEKFHLEKVRFCNEPKSISNRPVLPATRSVDWDVYNLKSENRWRSASSDNDFILIDHNNSAFDIEDELKDYNCSEIDDELDDCIIHINTVLNEINEMNFKKECVNNAVIQGNPRVDNHILHQNFGKSIRIVNNVGEANRIYLEYVKEKYDYPDLIIGNNIPKIKLDKEFNYVGKVNFIPFPKRDHGNLGE